MKHLVLGYILLVGILSLVTFVSYGLDKRRAQSGGQRVPERTLQLLTLFGGWPGGLLGQRGFRHKTRKFGFQLVLCLCATVHLAAAIGIAQLLRSRG